MTKVKVFVYGRRQRRQQQRRGYDNSSLDFRHGELISRAFKKNVHHSDKTKENTLKHN